MKGCLAFYEHSPRHQARLQDQVASPAGTIAAVLYDRERAGLRTAISRAVRAADGRFVQLGQGRVCAPIPDG